MTEKEIKFVDYWEETMKRGRLKYALLHGSLCGFLIFLFTFIFSFFDDSLDTMFGIPKIFVSLLVFIIGGIIFEGGYTWRMNTRRYRKLTPNSTFKK